MSTLPPIPLPIKVFFHCLIVILSTWGRQGFANSTNPLVESNRRFMITPTMIQELYRTTRVITSAFDVYTLSPKKTPHSREAVEGSDGTPGIIPTQVVVESNMAVQELNRLSQEKIAEEEKTRETALSRFEKIVIRRQILRENYNAQEDRTIDKGVIEGVSIAISGAPMHTVMEIFENFGSYCDYFEGLSFSEDDIFREGTCGISNVEILSTHGITPEENVKYQFAKNEIAGVPFQQTLRYLTHRTMQTYEVKIGEKNDPTTGKTIANVISVTVPTISVGWEIDHRFDGEGRPYTSQGVLMNNGQFLIQPYIQADGTIDESRTIILYHIYIKIDPKNYKMGHVDNLFKGPKSRAVIRRLAAALRLQTALRLQAQREAENQPIQND